jgi:hypothetical protein
VKTQIFRAHHLGMYYISSISCDASLVVFIFLVKLLSVLIDVHARKICGQHTVMSVSAIALLLVMFGRMVGPAVHQNMILSMMSMLLERRKNDKKFQC